MSYPKTIDGVLIEKTAVLRFDNDGTPVIGYRARKGDLVGVAEIRQDEFDAMARDGIDYYAIQDARFLRVMNDPEWSPR